MKKPIVYIGIFTAFTSIFSSCLKEKEFPVEPNITFSSFEAFNADSAHFLFSFTDGDGDVGLGQADSIAPYDANVYMTYFEMQNGEWVPFEFEEIGFTYRIPVLNPGWDPKPLEGDVRITVIPGYNNTSTALSDTFKWSAYMLDRSLNQSNVIESGAQIK